MKVESVCEMSEISEMSGQTRPHERFARAKYAKLAPATQVDRPGWASQVRWSLNYLSSVGGLKTASCCPFLQVVPR